jgi:hypothetical protein
LKTEGSIDDYRTRIVRTGKSHYRIDIRLILTVEQLKIIFGDLITKILGMLGGIMVSKRARAKNIKVERAKDVEVVSKEDIEIERIDSEISEIAQRILLELESASSKDLSDAIYAKMILHLTDVNYTKNILKQIEKVAGSDSEVEKRAVIKVLLLSTWLQRLYFIIRSFIMGELGAGVTFLFIWYIGSIDAIGMFLFGIFVFVFGLVITRLFDKQITTATKKIVKLMASHRTVRDFIMNHF